MRYSIMLQLVSIVTLILVAAAALFGWVQSRPGPTERNAETETPST